MVGGQRVKRLPPQLPTLPATYLNNVGGSRMANPNKTDELAQSVTARILHGYEMQIDAAAEKLLELMAIPRRLRSHDEDRAIGRLQGKLGHLHRKLFEARQLNLGFPTIRRRKHR